MKTEQYQRDFAGLWLRNVYRLMSTQFKKIVSMDDIKKGMRFGVEVGIYQAFTLARYAYGKPFYGRALGLLGSEIINRMDPINLMYDVEDIPRETFELYWEQMANLKYHMIYAHREVDSYELEGVEAVVYSNELVLMNLGKQLSIAYRHGNCLPANMLPISSAYLHIGTVINYLWVVSQLEPLQVIGEDILTDEIIMETINVA